MTKWEIHADYGGLNTRAISHIMSDEKLTPSPATRASLLSAALATDFFKDIARNEHYQPLVLEREYNKQGIEPGLEWLDHLGLSSPPLDDFASALPPYAWLIRLNFRLSRPYLSRDDEPFYIIDNPVRKDKVFKVPMVAPASWKGSLRSAATFGLVQQLQQLMSRGATEHTLLAARARLVMLFGNEKADLAAYLNQIISSEDANKVGERFTRYLQERGILAEKVEGHQGRLFFYPTFFDRIGLEIINPHLRDRRVGKNPIAIECAPAGSQGWFHLLYVPSDLAGRSQKEKRQVVASDLELLATAVYELFTMYGFGAKTSSGYGVALDNLVTEKYPKPDTPPPGQILLKATLEKPPQPPKPSALVEFEETQGGTLDAFTEEEWKIFLGKEFETYLAARDARDRYQEQVTAAQQRYQDELATGRIMRGAESFDELVEVTTDLVEQLRSEKGGTG